MDKPIHWFVKIVIKWFLQEASLLKWQTPKENTYDVYMLSVVSIIIWAISSPDCFHSALSSWYNKGFPEIDIVNIRQYNIKHVINKYCNDPVS